MGRRVPRRAGALRQEATLQTLGGIFGMHPAEFFGETTAPVGGVAELREAMRLAATLQRIASPSVRKRIVALIEELAGHDVAEHNSDQPTV